MRFSNSTKEFGVCKKAMGIKAETYGECGQNLRSRCEQSSAVVSKILRLKMWEIERMIVEDPDLKVIHLVRDPRGVSVSRNLVHYYFSDAAFCARLNQDSRVSARLQTQYPGRILTTRYEDLATDPTAIAKLLFDFARIPWSEAMERKVWKMTSNSDKRLKEDSFSTMRKNSSLTAFSWRQSIDERSVARLQNLCRQAMEDYGYLPLNSLQELRNQQIPSLTSQFSDKFYKAQVWR